MKTIHLMAFVLLSISALSAQTTDFAKIDSLLQRIEENERGMGSLAIWMDGELAYSRAIGYENVEAAEAAGPETIYGIGSISKVFTAVIALRLAEEGQLALNTRLSKYFPGLPNADSITVEQLLRHRSGLHNFTDDPDYATFMEQPQSREQLLERFADKGTDFSPGEKMSYSNTGYVILSFLLEEASGKSYQELLDQYILQTCGLKRTYLPEEVVGEGKQEALSYRREDGNWAAAAQTHPSIPIGAGALLSTPGELTEFMHCLFSGALVSEAHLEEMATMTDGYGLGLTQFPFYDKYAYGHTGGIDGFSSMVGYFPEEGVGIAYISNGTVMPINDIMIGALSIVFDKEYELPTFAPAIDVEEAQLRQYEGTYGAENFPLDIRVFVEDGMLKAQATGQGAFPLEAFAEHQFRFEAAGIEIEFLPQEEKMLLRQGGVYELSKK